MHGIIEDEKRGKAFVFHAVRPGLVKRSVVPNRVAPKTTDSQPQITPEPKVESFTVTAESDVLRSFIRENLDRGLFSEKDNPRYRKSKEIPAANCD